MAREAREDGSGEPGAYRSDTHQTDEDPITYTRQALASLAPTKASGRAPGRLRIGVVLAVLVPVIAAAAFGVSARSRQPALKALPIPSLPDCSNPLTAQCVEKYARTPSGIQVTFSSGRTEEYVLGRSVDALRVANFFCGQRATAALYEPDSGHLFYLSAWPDPESDAVIEVSVDATGITGASVSIGDHDRNGCADVALDVDGTRTWFLPSEHTGRLQRSPLMVEELST